MEQVITERNFTLLDLKKSRLEKDESKQRCATVEAEYRRSRRQLQELILASEEGGLKRQYPAGTATVFEALNKYGRDSIPLNVAVGAHGGDAGLFVTMQVEKDQDGHWGIPREAWGTFWSRYGKEYTQEAAELLLDNLAQNAYLEERSPLGELPPEVEALEAELNALETDLGSAIYNRWGPVGLREALTEAHGGDVANILRLLLAKYRDSTTREEWMRFLREVKRQKGGNVLVFVLRSFIRWWDARDDDMIGASVEAMCLFDLLLRESIKTDGCGVPQSWSNAQEPLEDEEDEAIEAAMQSEQVALEGADVETWLPEEITSDGTSITGALSRAQIERAELDWGYLMTIYGTGEGKSEVSIGNMKPYMFIGVDKAFDDVQKTEADYNTSSGAATMTEKLWIETLNRYKSTKGEEALDMYLTWMHGTIAKQKGEDWEVPKSIASLAPGLISLFSILEKLSGTPGHVVKEALNMVQGGKDEIFEAIDSGVNADGQVTQEEFCLYFLRRSVEKSPKFVNSFVTELTAAANEAEERMVMEASGEGASDVGVVESIPGVAALFKLMDQDDNGSINKPELVATCGGDYQMYEKMNMSGEGVEFEAFEAFFKNLGEEKGPLCRDASITALTFRAESRWWDKRSGVAVEAPPVAPDAECTLTVVEEGIIDQLIEDYGAESGGGFSVAHFEPVLAAGAHLFFGGVWTATEQDQDARISADQLKHVCLDYKKMNGSAHLSFFLDEMVDGLAHGVSDAAKRDSGLLTGDEELIGSDLFRKLDQSGNGTFILADITTMVSNRVVGDAFAEELRDSITSKDKSTLSEEDWLSALTALKEKRGSTVLAYYLSWLEGNNFGFNESLPTQSPSGMLGCYATLKILSRQDYVAFSTMVAATGGDESIFLGLDTEETGQISLEQFCIFFLGQSVNHSEEYVVNLLSKVEQGVLKEISKRDAATSAEVAAANNVAEKLATIDASAREVFNYLDYEGNGEFKKGAIIAAQGGDFKLFEEMGPNERGSVTCDIFIAWMLSISEDKGPKRLKLIIKNLSEGAKKRYEERAVAMKELEDALPGGVNKLTALLDFDLNGHITKDEIVTAQGGDFGIYNKMNPAPDGTVSHHQISNFLYELVASKGLKRVILLIKNFTDGAEAHLVLKKNKDDEAIAVKKHHAAGELSAAELSIIDQRFASLDVKKTGSIKLEEVRSKMPRNVLKQFQGKIELDQGGKVNLREFTSGISAFKREYGPKMLSYYLEWVVGTVDGFGGKVPSALPDGVLSCYAALLRLANDVEFGKDEIVKAQGGEFGLFKDMKEAQS